MPICNSGFDWVAVISVISSAAVGIFSVIYYNRKAIVYDIKKNTILKSLALLDNCLAYALKSEGYDVVLPVEKPKKAYTKEARECFNELQLTCKNEALLNTFMSLLYPDKFFDKPTPLMIIYKKYRQLCRKELGLKKLSYKVLDDKDIAFIGKIDPEGE